MSQLQLPSHLSRPPSGPLEVLMPERWPLSEPPRFGGKLISFLVAALPDTNTIEFDIAGRSARSSDSRLQEYLNDVANAGDLERLLQHCRAMMHRSQEEGALGWLGAVQEQWAYTFQVFQKVDLPNPEWEIRRRVTRLPESA